MLPGTRTSTSVRGAVLQAGAATGTRCLAGHAGPAGFPAALHERGRPGVAGAGVRGLGAAAAFEGRGSLDVKEDSEGHLCRHRCRVRSGLHTVYLTLSSHHREHGLALPYMWLQESQAQVWRVVGFFRP